MLLNSKKNFLEDKIKIILREFKLKIFFNGSFYIFTKLNLEL